MKQELKNFFNDTDFDVVLVRPPHGRKPQFDFFPDEHLGLTYLSAYLSKKGYKTQVLDCHFLRIDEENLIKILLRLNIKLLGFTVFQPDMLMVSKLAKKLKNKNFRAHITIGGQFPTFEFENILTEFPQIDSIIRYEGENGIYSLMQFLENKIPISKVNNLAYRDNGKIKTNKINPLKNLDTLPIPKRSHISEFPTVGIISSKGCYQNCSYCGVKNFYTKPKGKFLRLRSISDLVDEIEFFYRKYKKLMYVFWDDNFLLPGKKGKERVEEFCNELKKRNLKIFFGIETRADTITDKIVKLLLSAGLRYVFMGIESGNQDSLDVYNKKVTVKQNWNALKILSDNNVISLCAIIMYEPYSTVEKISENIVFLKKVFKKLNHVVYYPFSFTRLDIFKGTPIYNKLVEEKRIIPKPISEFIVEGDVYDIIDERVEKLANITMHLDASIQEYRLALWRYVSWFAGMKDISKTKHFVKQSNKFEDLLWKLNTNAILFTIDYLEKGLKFVKTEPSNKKLDSYIKKEKERIQNFIENQYKYLDKIISNF